MDFPHVKRETITHGGSPGNGITPIQLSRDPLATEGEATPGPDDYNPFTDRSRPREGVNAAATNQPRGLPTADPDPYAFDDVGRELERFSVPFLEQDTDGPIF